MPAARPTSSRALVAGLAVVTASTCLGLVASAAPASAAVPAFTVSSAGPGGDRAFDLEIADLDGNGRPDIAMTNNSGSLYTLLQGASGYTPGLVYLENFQTPIAIDSGDLLGDSRPEIVATSGFHVFLATADASGEYTAEEAISNVSPGGLALHDLDGDGTPELVVSQRSTGTVNVYGWDGSDFVPRTSFATAANPERVVVADVDGDSHPDVVAVVRNANYTVASVVVAMGTGTGTFGAISTIPVPEAFTNQVEVGQLDGDPTLEIVTGGNYEDAALLDRDTGAPNGWSVVTAGLPTQTAGITVADLDGDGVDELAATSNGAVTIRKQQSGGYTEVASVGSSDGLPYSLYGLEHADLDGDGDIDLAVSGLDGSNQVFQLINAPAATPTDTTAPTTTDDVPTTPVPASQAPFAVTLSATDDAGGTGVASIRYEIGSAGSPAAAPGPGSPVYTSAEKPQLQAGQYLRYSAVDVAGNAETPHDSATLQVQPREASVSQPVMFGNAIEGETISTFPVSTTPPDATVTWQWYRNLDGGARVDIPGATSSSYTLRGADVGRTVGVVATASAPGYDPGSADSGPTSVVEPVETGDRPNGGIASWGNNSNRQVADTPTGDTFVQVAAGIGHTVALREDGTVTAWGRDDHGQAASGVPAGSDFVDVDAAGAGTVALRRDGSVVAWGSDAYGQVSNAPTRDGFISISATDHGAIAVNGDGMLTSWGWDQYKQVTNTPSGSDFRDAAFGVWGGVAVRDDGTLVSWGLNNERQVTNTPAGSTYFDVAAGASHYLALGVGAETPDPVPAGSPLVTWGNNSNDQVTTSPRATDLVDMAGGIGHSLALRRDGSLVAWGRDDAHQAASGVPAGTDFVAVDAAGAGSMALRRDGSLTVWGRDVNGVVSLAPTTGKFTDIALGSAGTAVREDGTLLSWGNAQAAPEVAATPTGDNFASVDAGQNFTVALTTDGRVVVWGNNAYGQVSNAPTRGGFVSVSANDHGAIAVNGDGSLYAWGWNQYKQVTDTPTGTNFVDAAFGVWGGVAVRTDGTLVSWGLNNALQVSTTPRGNGYSNVAAGASHYMAIGTSAPAPQPEPAARLSAWGSNSNGQVTGTPSGTFKQFAAGIGHVVGLRPNGTVVAWGRDDHKQAASGVPSGSDFVDVDAGGADSIALRRNGSIVVWGRNVGGLTTAYPKSGVYTDVTISGGHGVALREDGSLVTWGQNVAGSVSNKPAGNDFVAVEAGQDFAIAIRSDGSLAAWGSNANNRVSGTPTGSGFVQVSIADHTAMALRGDGSIVAWGWDQYGQVSKAPKTGVFRAIAASTWGGAAVRADGSVVSWGLDNEKQVSNTPKAKGYFAIAAGSGFYLALGSTAVVAPDPVDTKLTGTPAKVVDVKGNKATVTFKFTADQSGAKFQCKVDNQNWKACTSPAKVTVALGKHTFKVRAVVAGTADSTPATFDFRVK